MLALILFIVAIILFILAAFNQPPGSRVNLIALGLAFLAAAMALPAIHGG